jgi:hypothetical protein
MAKWVTLLFHIWEVSGSNLGPETGFPEEDLQWFCSVCPGKCQISTANQDTITSFYILYNILFTDPTIWKLVSSEMWAACSSEISGMMYQTTWLMSQKTVIFIVTAVRNSTLMSYQLMLCWLVWGACSSVVDWGTMLQAGKVMGSVPIGFFNWHTFSFTL